MPGFFDFATVLAPKPSDTHHSERFHCCHRVDQDVNFLMMLVPPLSSSILQRDPRSTL
jgi:hypothetical protein